MNIINSPNLPPANGHYSQCIAYNGTLYLSGQLPINPVTREIPKTIEEQTDLVLSNISLILKEAGATKEDVIQVRLYVANIGLWDKVNQRYSIFFGDHKPVRSIIPVHELHFGCLIEIEVMAQSKK